MAVTGTFAADFSSFYDAVQKAEVHLRSFETGANKVEKQLDRVAESFSGRKIITEATLMAEAIERSGGVTKLTASELERAGRIAAEAADKMRRLGIEVPQGLDNLATEARRAGGETDSLGGSLRKVDGIMAAMGVNIGAEVRGLEEIALVSGKTTAQLGLLATASAAAASAFAGWKLGEKIGEWTGWTQAIADGTAAMMGWGDVAQQTVMAQADVIALAVRNGAAATISYTEAIKFNNEASRVAMNTQVDWTSRMQFATEQVDALTSAEIEQIQTARTLGATAEQLKDKFGLTADAVKALDIRLREESEAARLVEAQHKKMAEEAERDMERIRQVTERSVIETTKLWEQYSALRVAHGGTATQAQIAQVEAWFNSEVAKLKDSDQNYAEHYAALRAVADETLRGIMVDWREIGRVSRQALEDQFNQSTATYEHMSQHSEQFSQGHIQRARDRMFADREAWMNWKASGVDAIDATIQKAEDAAGAFDRMRESVEETTARARELKAVTESFSMTIQPMSGRERETTAMKFRQAGDTEDQALWRALSTLEKLEGTYAPKTNAEFFQMQANQLLLAQLRMWAQGKDRPPGFRNGVENFEGGLAYVHKDEALVNLPPGTSVIPAGRGGGATTVIVNMSGMVGDKFGLARMIKKVVLDAKRGKGQMVPLGAEA